MRIFFIHNPKAGGSALRAVLKDLAGGSEAPVFDNGPNIHAAEKAGYDRYRGFDYYAGHYGWNEYQRLADGHIAVSNFRDPIARVYSIYRYWRNNIDPATLTGAHPADVAIVALAHSLSFSDFIREESVEPYIANFHFRQLYGSGWEAAPSAWWARLLVKHRISRLAWFYVAETPDVSLALLRSTFPQAGDIPRSNESLGQAEPISPVDLDYLRALNALDCEIYDYALGLQERRFAKATLPTEKAA